MERGGGAGLVAARALCQRCVVICVKWIRCTPGAKSIRHVLSFFWGGLWGLCHFDLNTLLWTGRKARGTWQNITRPWTWEGGGGECGYEQKQSPGTHGVNLGCPGQLGGKEAKKHKLLFTMKIP